MERIEWKFGKGSEWYAVLWHNHGQIMVQNENSGKISFGNEEDFGSFYGFPVNNSCLTIREAKERLETLLTISKKEEYAGTEAYYLKTLGWNHITTEESMLSVINSML